MTEERLDFWTRRKRAVAAEKAAEAAAVEEAQAAEAVAVREAEAAEKTDAELLEELGLPDPDALAPGDDVKGFMQAAVPDRLRRRALRALWRTNPVLANLDMLVDYGEDFTDAATVVENLSTAYQVGKGMKAHVEEMARQAEEAAEKLGLTQEADAADADAPAEAEAETPPVAEAAPSPAGPASESSDIKILAGADIRLPERAPRAARPLPATPVPARIAPDGAEAETAAPGPDPAPEFAPPPKRRMRFAYDEA